MEMNRYYKPSTTPSSEKFGIVISSTRNGVDPATIHRHIHSDSPWRRWDGPLTPGILSTCRTIQQEATPILYSENSFIFRTDWIEMDITNQPRDLFKICKDLMSYDPEDWKCVAPWPLDESTLGAFVRKIGRANSNCIRSLALYSDDTNQAVTDLRIATQICAYHFRSLERMQLHIWEKEIAWEESPDYYHPDRSSPFWANGPLRPLLKALNGFVGRIDWLKEFEYDRTGQRCFVEHNAMNKIRLVESFVKQRSLQREVAEKKRQQERMKALENGGS